MELKMNNCERLDVNPKWPKIKTIEGAFIWSDKDESFYLSLVGEYIRREGIIDGVNVTEYNSEILGYFNNEKSLIRALRKEPWLNDLAEWNLYYHVGLKQDFFWHYKFYTLPDRKIDLKSYSFQRAANMLAVTSILGWKEAVIHQGYMTIAALNRGYQLEIEYEEKHRRAQAFILRLFCDWMGYVSHQWPDYAYDELIYENLLANWRTPNPEDLVPCLLAACDRHTWQTGRESSKNFYDFSTPAYMRVPIEILFLFRLREWEDLTNPTLDHPLMAAPFDKLQPEQPVPPLDDLMQAVLKRAREDWPHYDDVLSLEELKKPIDQVTRYDMPVKSANASDNKSTKGLFAKLFGK
jgi:hypothetical protein